MRKSPKNIQETKSSQIYTKILLEAKKRNSVFEQLLGNFWLILPSYTGDRLHNLDHINRLVALTTVWRWRHKRTICLRHHAVRWYVFYQIIVAARKSHDTSEGDHATNF